MPFSLKTVLAQPSASCFHETELKRLGQIFGQARGAFMWETPCAVDAFYAVMAYRLHRYQVNFVGRAEEYQQSLMQWPLFKQAISLLTPVTEMNHDRQLFVWGGNMFVISLTR